MIGVIGDRAQTTRLIKQLERQRRSVCAGSIAEVLASDPNVIGVVGESAILELLDYDLDIPILPVDVNDVSDSVPICSAGTVLSAAEDGNTEGIEYLTLDVAVDGETVGRGLYDVLLVTSDPVRISEYSVSADEPIARFRADGVVIGTPVGSYGYVRDAGGAVIPSGKQAVIVVPVGAFVTQKDQWVIDPATGVIITVEREGAPVSLYIDGEEVDQVTPHSPVTICEGKSMRIIEARCC